MREIPSSFKPMDNQFAKWALMPRQKVLKAAGVVDPEIASKEGFKINILTHHTKTSPSSGAMRIGDDVV